MINIGEITFEKGFKKGFNEGIKLYKTVQKLNRKGLTINEIAEATNAEIYEVEACLADDSDDD